MSHPLSAASSSAASSDQNPRLQNNQRRSTRHRNFLNRAELHQPHDLPEGYEQRITDQGQIYYIHAETGISTWHDPRVPRDFVNVVCADDLGPLPSGWETRVTRRKRVYFVNHNDRTTQFTDPRYSVANLNMLQQRSTLVTLIRPPYSAPPPICINSTLVPL